MFGFLVFVEGNFAAVDPFYCFFGGFLHKTNIFRFDHLFDLKSIIFFFKCCDLFSDLFVI